MTGRKAGVVFFLMLALAPAAEAGWNCLSFFARVGDGSPRGQEQAARARKEAVADGTQFLAGVSGRHLTTNDTEKRRAIAIIDAYLYIGDYDPVVTLYNQTMRRVETAKLSKNLNLDLIDLLATLTSGGEQAAATRATLKEKGLLNSRRERILDAGTDAQKKALLDELHARLETENRSYEKAMGREFELYKVIREHLWTLIVAEDKELLQVLAQTDSRGAVDHVKPPTPQPAGDDAAAGHEESVPFGLEAARTEGPEAVGRGASLASDPGTRAAQRNFQPPPDAVKALIERNKKIQEIIDKRAKESDAQLAKLEEWVGKIRNSTDTIDTEGLRNALGADYVSEDLRAVLAAGGTVDAQKQSIVRHLELLRARLRDVKQLRELAFKLEKKLGLQTSDFAVHRHLYPGEWIRPEVDAIQKDVYSSESALSARNWAKFRAELWTVVDTVFFYGWTANVVPGAGRAAKLFGLIKSEGPRNFVYGLFKNLYEKHIVDKHYPALTLLRRTQGNAEALLDKLELLNAGTHDELLLTFARRADMRELWQVIKDEAFKRKDTDHLELYQRMTLAETRGKDLGTLSAISQDSRVRYIVSTVLNGTLFYFGQRWLLSGDDDDEKKKGEPAVEMPQGGDEQTEEKAYAAAQTLVRLVKKPGPVTEADSRAAEGAAVQLMEAEAELRGEAAAAY